MVGRDEEGLCSLATLRRRGTSDETVQLEWKGILTEVRFQNELLALQYGDPHSVMSELKQWGDLFRPRYFKRTLVAIGIPFFQQVLPAPDLA